MTRVGGVRRAAPLCALVLTLAVAGPATALGQGGEGGPPAGRDRQGGPVRGERVERLLRARLGLTDAQVAQLRLTTRRFAPQRVALARQERAVADSLREQVAAATRDESLVSGLITRLFAVRRARLELREREQNARAAFMTPSQRAMLLGFEEQAQRRASSMRAGRRGGPR